MHSLRHRSCSTISYPGACIQTAISSPDAVSQMLTVPSSPEVANRRLSASHSCFMVHQRLWSLALPRHSILS